MEILLIDNNSKDRTKERIQNFSHRLPEFPATTLWNNTNRGYAMGVNQGLSLSRGDYVLLLGPDTKILPGALETMMNFLKTHPEAGLVAPQLVNAKGEILHSCRRFPTYKDVLIELTGLPRLFPSVFLSRWKMADFNHKEEKEVDQPEATCLMTHRKALDDVGFMDEQFTMFFNDVDWCRRFWLKGWKVFFFPIARIEHQKGASVYANQIPMIWKSHQGFYRYFQKYSASSFKKIINYGLGFILIVVAAYRSFAALLKK